MFSQKIDDLFFVGEIDDSVPIGIFENPDEILTDDFLNEISVNEYNELEKKIIQNSLNIFYPYSTNNCKKCGSQIKTLFYARDIVSDYDIKSIYEQYMDLSYYSSFTKSDIDGLLPFEREIFLGLLQKRELQKEGNINNSQNTNLYGNRAL